MSTVLEANDENFEKEVLQATMPVLVDFSAPWCGPCKTIDPLLEDLARNEWNGRIKIVKMNADESPQTVMKYGVMGLPTLLLFNDGKMLEDFRISGVKSKKKLMEEVEEALNA